MRASALWVNLFLACYLLRLECNFVGSFYIDATPASGGGRYLVYECRLVDDGFGGSSREPGIRGGGGGFNASPSDNKIHGEIPECRTLFQEKLIRPNTITKQFCKKTGELIKRLVESINDRFNDPKFKSDDPDFKGHSERINNERKVLEACRSTFNNNCDDNDYPPGFDAKRVRETLQRRFPGTRGLRDAYRPMALS